MKTIFNHVLLVSFLVLASCKGQAHIGTIKTEQYQAEFEKKQSIELVANYKDSIVLPIQLLQIGFTDEIYAMYPDLRDVRVGLGVTNIVLEFLDWTGRFEFTEDKLEIKERMVNQFKASAKGFTENKLDGKGKIKLARYFVYIEVYDFSVSEDEVVKTNASSQITQTTRLGLQVKFVDAETGAIMMGSGMGEASTVKTSTLLGDIDEIKFNQSTIGISTKKALETAASRVVSKMIKKGIFRE